MAKMSRLTKFVEAATSFSTSSQAEPPAPKFAAPSRGDSIPHLCLCHPERSRFSGEERDLSLHRPRTRAKRTASESSTAEEPERTSPTLHIPTSSRAEPLFRRREGSQSPPARHASETHSIRILNR